MIPNLDKPEISNSKIAKEQKLNKFQFYKYSPLESSIGIAMRLRTNSKTKNIL